MADIRDATQDDCPAIAAIYSHYVRTAIATFEELEPPADEMRTRFLKIQAAGLPYLSMYSNDEGDGGGRLCGYAYASPWHNRSAYRFTVEVSVYLHQDYCGKGLGKQLLQALIERLRESTDKRQALARIALSPGQSTNESPSCRLHIACGFREVGRLGEVGFKFDKWLDVVDLQLQIKER